MSESGIGGPVLVVVVPCHNEAATVRSLALRVLQSSQRVNAEMQLLFVNDGSTDDTLSVMEEVADEHPNVGFLSLSRRFGKESAILAGLSAARGDAVVLMDGDLQHPPEIIPELWDRYQETAADQVVARRDRVGDSRVRSFAARSYYRMVDRSVDVPLIDGEGDFRLMSRRAVDSLLELQETHRFSKGLFAWIGFPKEVVTYSNEARVEGSSSWGLRNLVDYGVDGILSFNARPLRTVIHLGWIVTALSLAYLVVVIVATLRNGVESPGYVTVIAAITLFGGIQLISLGVIGEYVGRIYEESKARPHYLVAQVQWPQSFQRKAGISPAESEDPRSLD